MVELPKPISPTLLAIDAILEKHQTVGHSPYIRGSEIGLCERRLFYSFRWVSRPEKFEGRMLRLFRTGHMAEAEMLTDLRLAGIMVVDRENNRQIEVEALNGHFKGHLDGETLGILEAPKTKHLVECKTHNAKSFAQLVRYGVAVAKPEHVAQMQAYMGLRKLTRAFYLARNKDTDELYAERLEFSKTQFDGLMAKAERVLNAQVPPPRISEDPDFHVCRYCPRHAVCHEKTWPLRTCRSCLHSTPIEDGQWHCSFHDTLLTWQTQNVGCPKHLFMPSLIDGEQVDASEADNTVTYVLANGEEWVDRGMV